MNTTDDEMRFMDSKDIPLNTRRKVWSASGNRCSNPKCRASFFQRTLEEHHIVPREFGGTNEFDNIILLCEDCHSHFHRGNIGHTTILQWKESYGSLTMDTSVEVDGYNIFFYHKLFDLAVRGRSDIIVQLCKPLFCLSDDPYVIVETGIPLATDLHRMGRDSEALEVLARVASALDAFPNEIGLAKRKALQLIAECRVLKGLDKWQHARDFSRMAQEISISEKYVGWQTDYYRSISDSLHILHKLRGPTNETFEMATQLLFDLGRFECKGIRLADAAVLKAEAFVYRAEYHCFTDCFEASDSEYKNALQELEHGNVRRGKILRLANWADVKLLQAQRYPRHQNDLLNEAQRLLEQSVQIGTFRGRLKISQTTAGDSIRKSMHMIEVLKRRCNPLNTEEIT